MTRVTYECGGTEITVRDGLLLVNDLPVATFEGPSHERAFATALNDYGDAMWRGGCEEADHDAGL